LKEFNGKDKLNLVSNGVKIKSIEAVATGFFDI